MVMEVYDETLEESMKYYLSGADLPYNFVFLEKMKPSSGGDDIQEMIQMWFDKMPPGKWPTFVVSCFPIGWIATQK